MSVQRRMYSARVSTALAVALAPLAALTMGVTTASAAPPEETTPTVPADQVAGDVGDVRLVDVDGHVINSGSGDTSFFIVVPDGAACPGDSANDQWRAQTFLLPEADDVLSVWFGSTGPEPPWEANHYPMFENQNGLPMSQMMLRRNATVGEPGIVEQSGETNFRVHAENDIASGRYRIGIACSYFRQTTQFWDLVVDIDAPAGSDPARLSWKVVAAPGAAVPATSDGDGGDLLSRSLVVLGVLILLAVAVSTRRARTRSAVAVAMPSTHSHVLPPKDSR